VSRRQPANTKRSMGDLVGLRRSRFRCVASRNTN